MRSYGHVSPVVTTRQAVLDDLGFQILVDEAIELWHASPSHFPCFERSYSRAEQEHRERLLETHIESIDHELRKKCRSRADAEASIARFSSASVGMAKCALEADDPYIDWLLRDGFSQIGEGLSRRARALDPNVNMIDVLQAARNAWTACGLQLLLGHKLELTPAIFAYSMLYPYSDNYLDDVEIPRQKKIAFNERFRARLEGELPRPLNEREEIIWALVGMIEQQYARPEYPDVYRSLLAIQYAQEASTRQLQREPELDVVRTTLTKGGTSVLADAYLAAGTLQECESRFALQWGVVLQLGDDLQDLQDDRRRGSATVFSTAASQAPLDTITNRTFHFGDTVMRGMTEFAGPDVLKSLLARSSCMLLIRSAASLPGFYTREYLAELERYSPVRFDFLRSRERRLARHKRRYADLFEFYTT